MKAKQYKATAVIGFNTGTLQLTAEQIKTRAGCLWAGKDGRCDVVKPIQFKAGETFGAYTDLDKHQLTLVQQLDADPAPAPAAPAQAKASEDANAQAKPAAADKPAQPAKRGPGRPPKNK